MKVLVVSSNVGKQVSDIASSFVFDEMMRLVKKGVEVHVARLKFDRSDVFNNIFYHDLENKAHLRVLSFVPRVSVAFPSFLMPRKLTDMYREILYGASIERLLRLVKPDVVHAHFAYIEGWSALLARQSSRLPLVITVHGYDLNILPEYRYGIRLFRPYDHIVRKVLMRVDCVFAVSKDLMRLAKSLGARCVIYLPNGVDTTIFTPEVNKSEMETVAALKKSWGVEDADVVVGFFRHIRPHYGVHYLLPATRYVIKKTRLRVKFLLAGDSSQSYFTILQKLLKKEGLDKHIVYIGVLPRTLMPMAYKTVDIVVNTSLTDGMPPSVLEAMASGKPVISFAIGGNKDIITHGLNGFLVPPGDYKALGKLLLALVENPEVRKKMGVNARRKIVDCCDLEQRIDKLIYIYRVLIEK